MIEIRFDKTKDEVALLIWFLVDHSVYCERQKYGINSLKIKQYFFFKKIFEQVNFSL
jgi:hypothetical protein